MLAPTVTALRCLTIGAMLALPVAPVCAQATCPAAPVAALFPSDAVAGNSAGIQVAMNALGDRVVVGSVVHGHLGVQSGAAWVFANPGTAAQTEAELLPAGGFTNMWFGNSPAINAAGNVVVVGAPGNAPATGSPRVYVFRFDGSTWIEEWHATGLWGDQLGFAVATNAVGDVVVAGAPMGSFGGLSLVGAVEVYRHHSGGWVHEATVRPANWAGANYFGNVLALSSDGNMLAFRSFGAGTSMPNGAVYLFEYAAGTWTEVALLQEPVAYSMGGFGSSISIDASKRTVAIGNYADSRQGYQCGAVSIFTKGSSGWAYDCVVLQQTPTVNNNFGRTVLLNAAGDRLLVGVPGYTAPSGIRHGAVLEFARSTSGWLESTVYFSPNQPEIAGFGRGLGMDATGRRWAAGEPASAVHGISAGLVHLFVSPCDAPIVYCTGKTNSLGCVPQIAAQGTPSASSSSGFTISVANTRNHQHGLLFYGTNGRTSVPWNGGTLCVQPPLMRTPTQNSGGTPAPTNDCSGAFAFDFNRWTTAGRDPALFAGQHVRAQYYSRDPGASANVGLSDGLEFYLEP